jgi:hypothetical protein
MFLYTGCGNSGNNQVNGTFIDDVVEGIKYINGNNSGYTDENGQFPYNGGTVEFFIGSIKIGELNSLNSDNKVFIQDLIPELNGDRTNIENERVLKIATFLQSLDSDDTTNKIEISRLDFKKFNESSNLSIDDLDVDTILSEKGFEKVSETNVKRHLDNVLKHHNIIEDSVLLEVKNTSVSDGDYEVEYDSSFDIEFTKDIKKDDVKKDIFILSDSKGNILSYDLVYDYDTVEIIPTESLVESEQYIITMMI